MDVTQSVVRGYILLTPSYLVGLHSTWMLLNQSVVRGYSLLIPSYLVGLHSTWMLLKVWLEGTVCLPHLI